MNLKDIRYLGTSFPKFSISQLQVLLLPERFYGKAFEKKSLLGFVTATTSATSSPALCNVVSGCAILVLALRRLLKYMPSFKFLITGMSFAQVSWKFLNVSSISYRILPVIHASMPLQRIAALGRILQNRPYKTVSLLQM